MNILDFQDYAKINFMKQKKLIIFVNNFKNIINFRIPLIIFLKKNNFDISIISNSENLNSIKYYEKKLKIKTYQIDFDQKGTNIFQELLLIKDYFLLINKIKPNLILSYTLKPNIYTLFVSKIFKIHSFLNITGLGSTFIENNYIKNISFFLYKLFKNNKAFYIFQNNDDKKLFINNNLCSKSNSFLIEGSGVDQKKFRKNLDLLYKKTNYFNFLMISRLIKHKGIDEFYLAVDELINSINKKKINFTLIGSYDPKDIYAISNKLFKKIKKSINIKYVPYTNNTYNYIKNSHCVILTSFREGFPMSLLEGAAVGRCLIASNVPGCKKIVKNNYNGFKYVSGDHKSLCEKMKKISNLSKSDIIKFSNNSHNLVQRYFNSDIINKKYLKILKQYL